jgi:SAM-dependent methyltransferase
MCANVLRNVGAGLPFMDRWRTPLTYQPDMAEYALSVYRQHLGPLRQSADFQTRGAAVLELGPGPHLGTCLLFALAGSSVTAVDIRRYLLPDHRQVLYQVLKAVQGASPLLARDLELDAGLVPAIQAEVSASDDDQLPGRITYVSPCDAAAVPLTGSSQDLVFSQAVLEHVKNPEAVVREQRRLLRIGGLASHQIDLRSHLDRGQPNGHRHFSARTWRWMTSNRSAYTNRLTRRAWLELFDANGFDVLECIDNERADLDASELELVHPQLGALTLDDMKPMGVQVLARRMS